MTTQWSVGEPNKSVRIISQPKSIWIMDFFGDGNLVFHFQHKKSWWARMWCSIIFGAKWKKP